MPLVEQRLAQADGRGRLEPGGTLTLGEGKPVVDGPVDFARTQGRPQQRQHRIGGRLGLVDLDGDVEERLA